VRFSFRQIKNLLRTDQIYRRLFRNAGILLWGNLISSILLLVSFALLARALGPRELGILVVIQTYVLVVDRLVNFQSWTALIKYGSELIEKKQTEEFKGLLKLGGALDLSTAVLGTILALSGAPLLAHWQGWTSEILPYIYLYSFLILFNISGSCIAILRLFHRFNLYILPQIIAQGIKTVLIVGLFFLKASFVYFLLACLFSDILAHVVLFLLALSELRRQRLTGILKKSIRTVYQKYGRFMDFVFKSNLSSAVRMLTRELDILIIGGILGEAAVGMFKTAKQFAAIPNRIFDPLYETIYPELSMFVASGKIREFKKLIIHSALSAGMGIVLIWIGFIIFGQQLIILTVGPEFLLSYPVMIAYMAAVVISVVTFPLAPAILSLEKYNAQLIALTCSTVLYFLFLPILLAKFSLNGAAYAYIIFYISWSTMVAIAVRRTVCSYVSKTTHQSIEPIKN
jgi:O-antigen/teichoic acid export membrane protein